MYLLLDITMTNEEPLPKKVSVLLHIDFIDHAYAPLPPPPCLNVAVYLVYLTSSWFFFSLRFASVNLT